MRKILLVFFIMVSLFGAVACGATEPKNKDNSSSESEKSSDGTVDLPMDEFD